jgi:membrane protein required for beta-lactamase induction
MIVLLALFVERVLRQHRPQRHHRWFDAYCGKLAGASWARSLMTRPWGAILALLPPLLLIAWLQAFFNDLGSLFTLVFGIVSLLYSLGPRDLGDEAEGFIAARDNGQDERASSIAEGLCLGEAPGIEPRRSFAVARAVVVLAAQRLIGPIFWFVVFGPVGAAAYRAIHLLAERLQLEDCPQGMKRYSDEARHIADWAPARITAAGYAIAGNFDAVAHAWRTFDYAPAEGPLTEAEHLLANAGLAALDTFPEDAAELAGGFDATLVPPVVEDALALVWRSLAMWVTVIAGGSLVAALA